jgi:hypothetical protein
MTDIPSVTTPGLRREHDPLSDALKEHFGHESFRSGQREIIDAIVAGRDAFALLPTGGGKSLTYQLPAVLLPGLTLVVSPLIALMHDQIERLSANGIAATALTSGLEPDEYDRRAQGVVSGAYRLLYVAPERLVSSSFLGLLAATRERRGIALLAVDEAHCVSEWGHDFRPEYRQLGQIRVHLGSAPVLALTATATELVRGDIATQLGLHEPFCWVGSFDRPNLVYEVRPKDAGTYSALLSLLDGVREGRHSKRQTLSQPPTAGLPQSSGSAPVSLPMAFPLCRIMPVLPQRSAARIRMRSCATACRCWSRPLPLAWASPNPTCGSWSTLMRRARSKRIIKSPGALDATGTLPAVCCSPHSLIASKPSTSLPRWLIRRDSDLHAGSTTR